MTLFKDMIGRFPPEVRLWTPYNFLLIRLLILYITSSISSTVKFFQRVFWELFDDLPKLRSAIKCPAFAQSSTPRFIKVGWLSSSFRLPDAKLESITNSLANNVQAKSQQLISSFFTVGICLIFIQENIFLVAN